MEWFRSACFPHRPATQYRDASQESTAASSLKEEQRDLHFGPDGCRSACLPPHPNMEYRGASQGRDSLKEKQRAIHPAPARSNIQYRGASRGGLLASTLEEQQRDLRFGPAVCHRGGQSLCPPLNTQVTKTTEMGMEVSGHCQETEESGGMQHL